MNYTKDAVIGIRLKYDWLVLLYGLVCVLLQVVCRGDWVYFFAFIGVFVIVEFFGVPLYRKVKNGGHGFHMMAKQTLDRQSSVGLILVCMALELATLVGLSIIFLVKLSSHCVK
jgi:diacylglycerol kinase